MSRIFKYGVAAFGALLLVSIPVKIFVGPYHAVTASMENTLRPGDHVFASAVFSRIERNDMLLFDYLPENTLYLFRCVGMPGDRFQIRRRDVFINNVRVPNPAQVKFMYMVEPKQELPKTFFSREGYVEKGDAEYIIAFSDNRYALHLTPAQADELGKLDVIRSVSPSIDTEATGQCFPQSPAFPWSTDNYGPLVIPRQGWAVELTAENVQLYGSCIRDYEGLTGITLANDTLYQGGKPLTRHTFGQDYYFMLGDNRHNAHDSRYWGFVPDNNVQGKVWWHTDLF